MQIPYQNLETPAVHEPERVFESSFQYFTWTENDNSLSEKKKDFGKNSFFDKKSQISGNFENSILCPKCTVCQTSSHHKGERRPNVNPIPHPLPLPVKGVNAF